MVTWCVSGPVAQRENSCHAQSTFSCDFPYERLCVFKQLCRIVNDASVCWCRSATTPTSSHPLSVKRTREPKTRRFLSHSLSHWFSLRCMSSCAPFSVCDTNGGKIKYIRKWTDISGVRLNCVRCFPMVCSLLDGLNSWWRVRELYPPTQNEHSKILKRHLHW